MTQHRLRSTCIALRLLSVTIKVWTYQLLVLLPDVLVANPLLDHGQTKSLHKAPKVYDSSFAIYFKCFTVDILSFHRSGPNIELFKHSSLTRNRFSPSHDVALPELSTFVLFRFCIRQWSHLNSTSLSLPSKKSPPIFLYFTVAHTFSTGALRLPRDSFLTFHYSNNFLIPI